MSRPMERKFQYFRGTPYYAHRQIFLSELSGSEWNPQTEYDMVGLGFTLAFFASGCKDTWTVGEDYPKRKRVKEEDVESYEEDLTAVMNARLEAATAAVNNSRIADDDLKRQITELLALDQKAETKYTSVYQSYAYES
jgi:hypothetical protein